MAHHARGDRLVEPRSVFRATATNHISYRVADYARSRDFYTDLLGTRCVYDDGEKAVVAFGTPPRTLALVPSDAQGDAPFVDHLAFSIANFEREAVGEELRRHGLEPEDDGAFAWTVRDPHGYPVQICAEEVIPPEAARPDATAEGPVSSGTAAQRPGVFRATAVNHVAFTSPDYARTRDFYLDLLGMRLAFEDGLKCSVAFGEPEDAIYIVPTKGTDEGPAVDHLAFSIADFELESVGEALRGQGHEPEDDGAFAWTIWDPDGYKIQICAEQGVYPGARRDPYHYPA